MITSEQRSLNHERTDYRRKVAVPVCAHSWQCNSHGFFILLHVSIGSGSGRPFGLCYSLMVSLEDSIALSYPTEISQDWIHLDIWTKVLGIVRDFLCCDAICTLLFVRVQSVGSCCFRSIVSDLCLYYHERCDTSWPYLSGTSFQVLTVWSDFLGLNIVVVRGFLCSICSQQRWKEMLYLLSYLHFSFSTFDPGEVAFVSHLNNQ